MQVCFSTQKKIVNEKELVDFVVVIVVTVVDGNHSSTSSSSSGTADKRVAVETMYNIACLHVVADEPGL